MKEKHEGEISMDVVVDQSSSFPHQTKLVIKQVNHLRKHLQIGKPKEILAL